MSQDDVQHGTLAAHLMGCRCDDCEQTYRATWPLTPTPPGLPGGDPQHGSLRGARATRCWCGECQTVRGVYAMLLQQRRAIRRQIHPENRWRAGIRDDQTRAEHAARCRADRHLRALRQAEELADAIVCARRRGDVVQAAYEAGLSAAQIRGVASWCGRYQQALDDALRAGCRARTSGTCGTPAGYRTHHGRCPDCQAAHRRPPAPASPLDAADHPTPDPRPATATRVRDAARLTLTTIRVNTTNRLAGAELGDLWRLRARVLDMVARLPEPDTGRTLWAHPLPNILTIRDIGPIQAEWLPHGWADEVTHQPWTPPPAGPAAALVTANPVRAVRSDGRDRPQRVPLVDHDDQAAWLAGRLAPFMSDVQVTVVSSARRRALSRRRFDVQTTTFRVFGTVTDPDGLGAYAVAGIGRAKAWGCGLSVWETPS